MTCDGLLDWTAALASGCAALLWLAASLIPIPKVDGSYGGIGELEAFAKAITRASRLNAFAAIFASIAAAAVAYKLASHHVA